MMKMGDLLLLWKRRCKSVDLILFIFVLFSPNLK